MNKLRLFLGIGSLLIAMALFILNLTLPPESLWFDIGYGNMPWIPPVVFAIIGIVLLATAGIGKQETPQTQPAEPVVVDPEKAALNKRLESIAWGCFLIMLAGFLILPKVMQQVPEGLWSIGVGVIMLGLNVARYFSKIRMSGFTTVLGILSLIGGILELVGVTSLEGGLLLIILGAYLILKPWFEQQKLFGKAEQA